MKVIQTKASLTDQRRKMYDATAGFYTATFPYIWRYGFPSVHQWLADELVGCKTILDAGCGSGYWSLYMASVHPQSQIIAMDFSYQYITRSQRYTTSTEIQHVQGDINLSPLRKERFDAILCSGVLDTFPDKTIALREFHRLLSPDSKLLLILRGKGSSFSKGAEFVFRNSIGMVRAIKNRSFSAFRLSDNLWSRVPLWKNLNKVATDAGFEVVYVKSTRIITMTVLKRLF